MRRSRIKRLMYCLVIGGILANFVSGITCWQFGEAAPAGVFSVGLWRTFPLQPKDLAIWRRLSSSHWPEKPKHVMHFDALGVSHKQIFDVIGNVDITGLSPQAAFQKMQQKQSYWIYVSDYGWPFHCLRLESWTYRKGAILKSSQTNGWQVGSRLMPTHVLLSGALANCFIYGSIICCIAISFKLLTKRWREAIRRSRGCCTACGYDLRSEYSTGCPECGWNRDSAGQ